MLFKRPNAVNMTMVDFHLKEILGAKELSFLIFKENTQGLLRTLAALMSLVVGAQAKQSNPRGAVFVCFLVCFRFQ